MKYKNKTKIKICGITNIEDALSAVEYGADALGFVLTPSKRRITIEKAKEIISQLPPFIITAGIFMDQPLKYVREAIDITGIDLIQLHGNEDSKYCNKISKRIMKRVQIKGNKSSEFVLNFIKRYNVSGFILDPGAGSGETFDWNIISTVNHPLIIAGGLTPENVGILVEKYYPYAVDVSSGVEISPGKKDANKVKKFIKEVRGC